MHYYNKQTDRQTDRQTDNFNKKKSAMTLAEVLITLGIIGVVAAFTIPTLIANTQKQEYTSNLKKAFSEINQALMKYAVDQGCSNDLQCSDLFVYSLSTPQGQAIWQNFFNNYLKTAQICGMNTNSGCFPSSESFLNTNNYVLRTPDNDNYLYKVVLNDGISLWIYSDTNGCTTNKNIDPSNPLYDRCGVIGLDVNGLKKPNSGGRDYFDEIVISRFHGLVPLFGSQAQAAMDGNTSHYWKNATNEAYNCTTSANSTGRACFAKIIEEGWQMNY